MALRRIRNVQRAEGSVVGHELIQCQLRSIGKPTARVNREVADAFAEDGSCWPVVMRACHWWPA